jgi:probable F420-dependent oxidoreductase
MKFDTSLLFPNLGDMAGFAQAAEAIGFDGIWTSETRSDPFLPLAIAAEHSQHVTLGTAIAVAFPRTPTILAHLAWDLARYSHGRFVLGLGTQVKAHNERRLGATWHKPVRKLQETIEAIHAIWDCWEDGTPLRYEGEFFKLDLMTPFFSTGPLGFARPPIYISAVNQMMLELAGKRADGVHLHALHTERYLREFALPHIEAGLAANGRTRAAVTLNTGIFVIPTDDVEPAAVHEQFVRQQISFYLSTPAYRVVAEMHGWEEIAFSLSKLARRGEWGQMAAVIPEEMLAEMAITGTWAQIPHLIHQRYKGLLDRVSYYMPFIPGRQDEGWRTSIAEFNKLR